MLTIVGVTAGEIYNSIDPWSPVTFGQSRTYTDAIIDAGGVPLIMPITHNRSALRAMYETIDGLLLAGGNDINPKLYNQKPALTTKDVSDFRDACEVQLLKWALKDKKPVLAICRGMQLLNAVLGGTLYQDIPMELPAARDHNESSILRDAEHLAHPITIKPDSKLARILEMTEIQTNSHHHQAIKVVASNLEAVAWAGDGVIEAVEGRDAGYIVGVQSHPESLYKRAEKDWRKLFLSFIEATHT